MGRKQYNTVPPHTESVGLRIRRKVSRLLVHFFVWTGMAVIYYVGFSMLFDTPVEYRMKRSSEMLFSEYHRLSERYDSINMVLDNVIERDRSMFNALFEAQPYDFDAEYEAQRSANYERLLSMTNRELGNLFFEKSRNLDRSVAELVSTNSRLGILIDSLGSAIDFIPSIQPVLNRNLTLLTASYGMRMHPFYRRLASHQGVDYAVPEGSRVFATADGTVQDIITRQTAGGLTIVLTHSNGYRTEYQHLSQALVRRGQRVRRGDIIAWSGNTGLSFAPHLHYEVIYNGMRVDPIHYFFMELSPDEYQKIMQIARSGMQSFD